MDSISLKDETFDSAKEKILLATHEKSKSAQMLRRYLINVLKLKFGHMPKLKDFHIGIQRREKWSIYVKKIENMRAIVPIVDSKPENQNNSLMKFQSQIQEYHKNVYLEQAKDALKMAEENKRNDILKERQERKRERQAVIDQMNEDNIRNYNLKVEELKAKFEKEKESLQEIEDEREVDHIDYRDCLPFRIGGDRDKLLLEKVKITIFYKNGYKRSFNQIKEPTEEEKATCFSCSIPDKPEYSTNILDGKFRKDKYYFKISSKDVVQKKAQENFETYKKKFEEENPIPEKIPDAKTEVTHRWVISQSCSSLGVVGRYMKDEPPPTKQIVSALQEIKKWQVVHGKNKATIRRNIYDVLKDEKLNHNKYSVLQNHKSCVEVNRLANYKVSDVLKKDDDGRINISKKQETARRQHIKKIRAENRKESNLTKLNPITGPNVTFKNMILMIINSRLFSEEKIKQEKQFTGESLEAYLEHGFLRKQDCHLNKNVRKTLKRILDDLFEMITGEID